jgi:hypothetical protein
MALRRLNQVFVTIREYLMLKRIKRLKTALWGNFIIRNIYLNNGSLSILII